MDCSTFQNHGKALFSLKKRRMTIHGRPFYLFLPFASLVTIIYGGRYGNHLKTKLKEKIEIWYYGRLFFAKIAKIKMSYGNDKKSLFLKIW
jgi:hypothetical protein